MTDGHVQTARQDQRGHWYVECRCGAQTPRCSSNYEAWQMPLNHLGLSGVR